MGSSRPAGRSAERALLATAARAFLDKERSQELAALAAQPLDWEWICRWAEAERLAPLLYAVLRPLSPSIPILDRLRAAWVHARRQHLLGAEQLARILAAFQREGLPVIPLKGPALAETLYRDPGVRPFTDLDLLIRGADLPGALQLLSALGYRHLRTGPPLEFELAWRHAASFVNAEPRPDHLPVDLHWQLLDYPGGAPAAAIDHREIWGQAIEVDGWGQRRLELCPEDLLIYLALHWAVHHACSGLIWQLDLALLLRRHGSSLDWEGVAERARRWRVSGGLHFALQVFQERLNVGPPSRLMAELRPRGPRRWALVWLGRRSDEELERLDYLVPVLLLERSWDVLRLLARSLFPAARWVRARYGQQSLVGAYAAHYGRIARVCLRTLRACLGRSA